MHIRTSTKNIIQSPFIFSEHLLGEKLTVISGFHSHLEPMQNVGELDRQISLSYSEDNAINLEGPFSKEVDPTR